MKSKIRSCSSCQDDTEHLNFGLVPESLFSFEKSAQWYSAMLCTECGALNRREVTEAEETFTKQRLMSTLRDIGLYEKLYGDDSGSGVAPAVTGD